MSRPITSLLVPVLMLSLSGCGELLDVENPNNLVQEDIDRPTGSAALANGTLSTLTRALGQIIAPYSTVTDEILWVGSRDAWQQLDKGTITDPANEFVDVAFPFVAEARWMADEAIAKLEQFAADGELDNPNHLVQSYVNGAIIYMTIGDMFDDFVFSDRMEPGVPIGEDNMDQMYTVAIDYLTQAHTLAQQSGNADAALRALALRARAEYSRDVWGKLNPKGATPADPLVANAAADADAMAVLGAVGTTNDWRFRLDFSSSTVSNSLAGNVNERSELNFGPAYVSYSDPPTNRVVESVILQDPIDGIPAPEIQAAIDLFRSATEYASITVASAREMHLILAESALAGGDMDGFVLHVNHVRAMDGVTSYDPDAHAIAAIDLLQHERRVSLYLQGRRLQDHYRFDDAPADWLENSDGRRTVGTFFPITIIEIMANPNIAGNAG